MKQLALVIPLLLALAASAYVFRPAAGSVPADEHGAAVKLEDVAKLTVRGEAELARPADRLRLAIGVVSEGREASRVLRENNELMDAVIRAIEKAGLTEDEYETGRFRIRPQYSRRPRQPEEDWRPTIIGYEVTNTISVKTKKLDLAGELIGAANDAGANTVEVVGFDLADPRAYRSEAIAEATANAIADARELAAAASLDLVRIINITLDRAPVAVPEMAFQAAGRAMADAGSAPSISAGDVTVRASVSIVYEIAPKHTP